MIDISIIPIMFFTSFILFPKNQRYNFKLFFTITFILLFFIFISNSNLIYAQIFSGPFHREEFLITGTNLSENLFLLVKNFFSFPNIKNPYFVLGLPMSLYIFSIILISLFLRDKITYFIVSIIFIIFFIVFISNLEFIVSFKNNSQGFLKTYNWSIIGVTTLPVLYGLLFIVISKLKIK